MSSCRYKYKGGNASKSCYLCSSGECQNGHLRCSHMNSTCYLTADCDGSQINIGYVGLKTYLQRRRICAQTGVEYKCDDENDELLQCSPKYPSGLFQFKFLQRKRGCYALISGDKYNLQDMRCACKTCECIFCENHDLQCTCDVQLTSVGVSTHSVSFSTAQTTVPITDYTEQTHSTSDFSATTNKWNTTGTIETNATNTENVTSWDTTSKKLISRDTDVLDGTGYIAGGISASFFIVVLTLVLYLFLRKRRMGTKIKRDSQSSHFDNAAYHGFNPESRCCNLDMPHKSETKENMYEEAAFLTDRSISQETKEENNYDTIEFEAVAAANNYDTPTRHYMEMKKPVLYKHNIKAGMHGNGSYTIMGQAAENIKSPYREVTKQDDAYEYSHDLSNRELCSYGNIDDRPTICIDEDDENVYQVIDDNVPGQCSKGNCDYVKDNRKM